MALSSCPTAVRLCDIGAAIQEVMESYEVELDGKVRCILCPSVPGYADTPPTLTSTFF